MDELRKMYAELSKGTELVKQALEKFDSIKQGNPGLPGTNGAPGRDGKSVTPADVEAAVRKILVQPKDGVAPSVEDVATQVLKSPKLYKFIQKRLREETKTEDDAENKEEKDEMEATKKMVEEIANGFRKELENKMAEVRNFAATQIASGKLAGAVYGKDTWARGGGDTVEAGTNITITEVDGRKRINSTGGSGGGFQVPLSGAVDGNNVTFVWATAPNVIVTDQGKAMQKVSSDGTVNWTGTTTTVLTVAPTSDIYATA